MGQSEKEICIKCDKGGEVLACADSCCPIAVHVRCMGCPARFDDSGKFYCPYCLYRRSIAKFHQAKEHVLTKKQALHTFIDKEMIDNVREVPSICERADEPLPEKMSDVPESNCDQQGVVGKQIHSGPDVDCGSKSNVHTSSKAITTDFRVLEAGNSVQVNDLQEVGEHQLEKSVEDHRQNGHLNDSSVAEKENSGNELVLAETRRNSAEIAEQMRGSDQTTATLTNTDPSLQQHLHGKRRAETGDLTCGESRPVSTQRECGKQVNKVKDEQLTDSPRRLTRTSASLLETSNAAGELVQVKQPSMLLPVILPNGKRRRVLWRREEEEMIEEGVQKFSSTVNKNIPWRKILEFGRRVFDHTRTPTDLKDKWKQICSKYGGRV
ncbi:hypothetical protein RND71_038012 [Anisodus tanguticus]|uniref:Myb-like domain-containing protein n=1 Tax=Anisodus tanguticus TaxID=243964 RepID=A0AAE1QZQ3_9SOLA|nr:hypothetical protein RND71_038012 [Anisodus tanguticus]